MSGDTTRPTPPRRLARRSLLLVALFAAAAAMTAGPMADPQPVSAGTAETMESMLIGWINNARAARGIPKLSIGPKLMDAAGSRAATMARTGKLKHADCLSCLLRSYSISFSRCGEVISYTTYPWGRDAAWSIYIGWKGSSMHWSMLMSRDYTRFGIGVAYRSSSRSTFAAGILVR